MSAAPQPPPYPSEKPDIRSQIRSAFADTGLRHIGPDIMSKCLGLASTLHVSPKQMAECWEALSINKNLTKLDDHSFASYRSALIKESDDNDGNLRVGGGGGEGAIVARPVTATANKRSSTTDDGDEESGPSPNSVTPPSAKRLHVTFDDTARSAVDAVAVSSSSSSSSRRVSLSPAPPGSALKPSRDKNAPKYDERSDAGKVVHVYNPNKLEALPSPATKRSACTISYDFDTNVQEPYRHFFTTMEQRAMALDRHLVKLGDAMTERYGLARGNEDDAANDGAGNETGIAPLEAVGIPRQEKICCIGRICNSAHLGRMNATTVLLEGSRNESGGARTEVDLSLLQKNKVSYSLFPGQIVAVQGMNASGRKMVADRVCEGAAHEAQASTVRELLRYKEDQQQSGDGGGGLKMIVACGPFTTSDNLDYQPLNDLMNVIVDEKPDVVLLSGPFVDMEHGAVRCGQATIAFDDGGGQEESLVSFETLFASKVAFLLEEFVEEQAEAMNTQFVLVPSLDDATAEWVFPQPPFADRTRGKNLHIPGGDGIEIGTMGLRHIKEAEKGGRRRRTVVHCVSNPCTIKLNEIVLGISSADAMFHLNAAETSANLEPGSRLGRIAQHMLQQRSYYPLFPGAHGVNVNLDLAQADKWDMPCRPDILVVPSKLARFSKTILGSTIAFNPGRLCRDTRGGHYAIVNVHPIPRETLENAGGDHVRVPHAVHERTRIEIKCI